jgi:AcrR family transcriptional regulator
MAEQGYGLRERKRTRTRLMIQSEALRLFAEKGYDETTVEEIAFAAAISPRTFFRYFPSKEDVVLWDEYDPLTLDLLAARPDEEPPAQTLVAIMREALAGLQRRDPEGLLVKVRLLTSVPELRARLMEQQATGAQLLAAQQAERRGQAVDEIALRVVATALGGAAMVALDLWQTEDGKTDLVGLVDRAIGALAESMRDLQA